MSNGILEIRGWMTEGEQYALRRLAFGKDVLEIGSYHGLSTINLAATARSVTAVDTFDARATIEGPEDTYHAFMANLVASGNADKVLVRRGLDSDVLPMLDRNYDLIFIDGDHSQEAVKRDIELSLDCLREGGLLAFHDYCSENMGVVQAIDEFVAGGAQVVAQHETIAVISPTKRPQPIAKEVVVALVMPHRNLECHLGAAAGLHFASNNKLRQVVSNFGTSILTYCFNHLLADAMNAREIDGVTHFAMLHNDVVPCRGWLDILMAEMQAGDYDAVSAVVPLKNNKGLTSTGIETIGNPWTVRRLTMAEVYDLPETFAATDIPFREPMAPLLMNTGCWLMKLDEPWTNGLHFRQQDRIAWCTAEKKYAPQSISEDWDFSRQLASRGCRLAVTRKVSLHHDRPEFHNRGVWGEWTMDESWSNYQKMAAAQAQPELVEAR